MGKKRQPNFWDAVANEYRHLYGDRWSIRENQQIATLIGSLTSADFMVLDLGCGQGLGARLLEQSNIENICYVGIDTSYNMLRFAYRPIYVANRLIRADMESIPLADASMNLVISIFNSVSYAADPTQVFKEIARVLAPGGRFLVMTFSRWSLRRLLKLEFAKIGRYGTSGVDRPKEWEPEVTFFTASSLRSLARSSGLDLRQISGQSPFKARIFINSLWLFSQLLGWSIPSLGHSLIAVGGKPIAEC